MKSVMYFIVGLLAILLMPLWVPIGLVVGFCCLMADLGRVVLGQEKPTDKIDYW